MPPILLLNCSYWVSLETWWEFLSVFYSYYFQRKLLPVSDVTAATHNGCKSLWAYCLLDWAFGSSPKNNKPSAIGQKRASTSVSARAFIVVSLSPCCIFRFGTMPYVPTISSGRHAPRAPSSPARLLRANQACRRYRLR